MNDKMNVRENLILIVDDSETMRSGLTRILMKQGYKCVSASDGLDAIEQLKKGLDVDLVLVDIEMPGMGGIEAVRHLKKDATLAVIPVIVLSAWTSRRNREDALEAGAAKFIAKPVNVTRLLGEIETLLSA